MNKRNFVKNGKWVEDECKTNNGENKVPILDEVLAEEKE